MTRGEGVTIAIIDDGVDTEHPEFPGAGKIVAPRATLFTDNSRPKDLFGTGPDHGDKPWNSLRRRRHCQRERPLPTVASHPDAARHSREVRADGNAAITRLVADASR